MRGALWCLTEEVTYEDLLRACVDEEGKDVVGREGEGEE